MASLRLVSSLSDPDPVSIERSRSYRGPHGWVRLTIVALLLGAAAFCALLVLATSMHVFRTVFTVLVLLVVFVATCTETSYDIRQLARETFAFAEDRIYRHPRIANLAIGFLCVQY